MRKLVVLVAAGGVLLVCLAVASVRILMRRPTDQELVSLLSSHRREFDECAQEFLRIAPVRLRPGGECESGDPSRVVLCRRLAALGVRLATQTPDGRRVLFATYLFGMPDSVRKGLAFSPDSIAGSAGDLPVEERELTGGERAHRGFAYRHIEGPWYVYLED